MELAITGFVLTASVYSSRRKQVKKSDLQSLWVGFDLIGESTCLYYLLETIFLSLDPALLDRRLVELIQAVDELRRQLEKLT